MLYTNHNHLIDGIQDESCLELNNQKSSNENIFNGSQLPSYLKDYQIFNNKDHRDRSDDDDSKSQESDHTEEQEDDDDDDDDVN